MSLIKDEDFEINQPDAKNRYKAALELMEIEPIVPETLDTSDYPAGSPRIEVKIGESFRKKIPMKNGGFEVTVYKGNLIRNIPSWKDSDDSNICFELDLVTFYSTGTKKLFGSNYVLTRSMRNSKNDLFSPVDSAEG